MRYEIISTRAIRALFSHHASRLTKSPSHGVRFCIRANSPIFPPVVCVWKSDLFLMLLTLFLSRISDMRCTRERQKRIQNSKMMNRHHNVSSFLHIKIDFYRQLIISIWRHKFIIKFNILWFRCDFKILLMLVFFFQYIGRTSYLLVIYMMRSLIGYIL